MPRLRTDSQLHLAGARRLLAGVVPQSFQLAAGDRLAGPVSLSAVVALDAGTTGCFPGEVARLVRIRTGGRPGGKLAAENDWNLNEAFPRID